MESVNYFVNPQNLVLELIVDLLCDEMNCRLRTAVKVDGSKSTFLWDCHKTADRVFDEPRSTNSKINDLWMLNKLPHLCAPCDMTHHSGCHSWSKLMIFVLAFGWHCRCHRIFSCGERWKWQGNAFVAVHDRERRIKWATVCGQFAVDGCTEIMPIMELVVDFQNLFRCSIWTSRFVILSVVDMFSWTKQDSER